MRERSDHLAVLRIIDANFNRAMEGLRVVEDFTRFALNDQHLTSLFKQVRHELASLLAAYPMSDLVASRDTSGDVGTDLEGAGEYQRGSACDVAIASQKRVEQSLRCLEEYTKLGLPQVAAGIEQLRYRVYTLGKSLIGTAVNQERLKASRLYVLIDGASSAESFGLLTQALVAVGVHVLQLRDKRLNDKELVERARQLRDITRGSQTLMIVNDRADIAVLADADGVHVGQDELAVRDARAIVGAGKLVGVSTHTLEQARFAALAGADYLGCGPTFPSNTKTFDAFPGTPFLHAVAQEIALPAFAIGGINATNVRQVLDSGFRRIAVSSAVTLADDPPAAAVALLHELAMEEDRHGRCDERSAEA